MANIRQCIFGGSEVESDSSPPLTMSSNRLASILEERPNQLPLKHLPPKRTSSQERFNRITTPSSLAGSPHTISIPKNFPFFLHQLQNMSDEDVSRIPDDVYKRYIKEKADRIVQQVVPEPTHEVDRIMSLQSVPLNNMELSHDGFPKQRTLFPLDKDQLEVGQDGGYFERRNYNRVEDLGEGGFGMVYACLDTCNENLFAIKCNIQSDTNKVSSMKRECEVLFFLGQHQNITRFLGSLLEDHGTELQGQSLKMLMECAVNGSLDDMIIDPDTGSYGYGLPLDQTLYYMQQILLGVDFLHQHNTLHLDLKCKNILVFDEGRTVKLADFGSAMKKEEISMTGSLIGCTPHYSAPEVINQSEVPSYSADVWSSMCVLIEMWTGKMPWCLNFDHNQQSAMLLVGRYEDETDFEKLVPYKMEGFEVSDDVLAMLKTVLIKDSKNRPSAIELLRSPVIIKAVEYEQHFEEFLDEGEEDIIEEEQETDQLLSILPVETNDLTSVQSCPPIAGQRESVDSGVGRSLPDRLSSYDSGSCVANSPLYSGPRVPTLIAGSTRYQILRHDSAPFLTIPVGSLQKFEDIRAHFGSSGKTISSNYIPKGILHSNSAPSDFIWNNPQRIHRLMPRGGDDEDDDTEKDGPTRQNLFKRTPSSQYVSNGPEVDSPDGRRAALLGSPPQTTLLSSPTLDGMVSVGTQTSLSPTVEGVPPFPGPETINCYNKSQTSVILLN